MLFPVAGVEVNPFWPFLVAFLVSLCSSLGGVSGAFLLLPYQVSILGFQSPAVSSTNLLYNLVAIPGGVARFVREGRMLWPLAGWLVGGLAPGICLGVVARVLFLPDPRAFKLFVGLVLLLVGLRLALDLLRPSASGKRPAGSPPTRVLRSDWRRVEFTDLDTNYHFDPLKIALLGLIMGVISGAYGIGGGAILAPLLVSMFRLPVHAIAGATLASTFAASIIGIPVYCWIAPLFARDGAPAGPDWLLGLVLGAGGMLGIYLGARFQRLVPASWIKALLVLVVLAVSVRYIAQFQGAP
ncbi:MAG: sulfite exporter TauE/SafE family protein [Planctomycetota bacterium]